MELPAPLSWTYAFADADFSKNVTIHWTVICICIQYILLVFTGHRKDAEEKSEVRGTVAVLCQQWTNEAGRLTFGPLFIALEQVCYLNAFEKMSQKVLCER